MADPADIAARIQIREQTDRTLFVSAGAGSGKTTSLVGRVAHLVLHDGLPMPAIATVTFTIKAAAELRDRLRAKFEKVAHGDEDGVRRQRAQTALDELDLAAIGTLHRERLLVASLQADRPDISDKCVRIRPHRVLGDFARLNQLHRRRDAGKTVLLILTHRSRGTDLPEVGNYAGGWHTHLAILIALVEGKTPPKFWANATPSPKASP